MISGIQASDLQINSAGEVVIANEFVKKKVLSENVNGPDAVKVNGGCTNSPDCTNTSNVGCTNRGTC